MRTSRATIDYTQNPPFPNGGTWNTDTTINVNIDSVIRLSKANRIFQANNNANVVMNFNVITPTNAYDAKGIFTANSMSISFEGNGFFDITANISGNTDSQYANFIGMWDEGNKFTRISSRFRFQAQGNLANFINLYLGDYGNGKHYLNSPYIEIDMSGSSRTDEKYIIYNGATSTPSIYINANQSNTSQADNNANILKLTGSIYGGTSKLYAYFTNSQSFLKGNLRLANGNSIVSFSNGSSMSGNIIYQNNGNHSITFDNASFVGVVKSSDSTNRGSNSSITFTNTAGQTFGSNEGVVDSSYNGRVVGTFDLSANSTTRINGGALGDKGFFGSGTNNLTFDFKGNAKTNTTSTFTIGGGNANSVYILSGFQNSGSQTLDLSTGLSATDTLYKKIEQAGLKIAVDTQSDTAHNHLNGTLLFTHTNMQVGDSSNALFASKDNIVGTSNSLNNLTLGAMFGNATWVDSNNDGYITGNEIRANAGGTNYKLTNGSTTSGNGIDTNTSTGNIGSANDNIKKQIGFIFTDGSYDFGGDKQGYSGIINGGTNDSKYYFANAGYITRTQINNALGDLVLFNTAFRGDLGVSNDNVAIMLDFSNGKNGLRAEVGTDNANIVGAGSKNITFNFTGNTKAVKFEGAVVGDASKTDSTNSTADNQTAKYTMLNLVKYSQNGTMDGNGALRVESGRAGSKTLINALQESGLTNFDNPSGNGVNNKGYGQNSENTNISALSTSATTLALRGTSLNTTNLNFDSYKYDFVFGSNIGEVEGVTIEDSKLYGDIDLSSNANTGHSIILRGDSLGQDSATITFGASSVGSGASVFVYDDSTATRTATDKKTLKLSGLTQTNYLGSNSALNISNTNLEGDIWASNATSINLNFTNGNTWKMNTSGLYLASGSNIIVNGSMKTDIGNNPTLKLKIQSKQGDIQLINTGATLVLNTNIGYYNNLAKSFKLRGTSLKLVSNGSKLTGSLDTQSFDMVFAKGTNLQTNVSDNNSGYYNITDESLGADNYIAQSSANIKGFDTQSGFNLTFIGESAWENDSLSNWNNADRSSKLTLINASNTTAFDGSKIGTFFNRDSGGNAQITLQGTSLTNGNNLVKRSGSQGKLTFNLTFIKDSSMTSDGNYVTDKYGEELMTTNANGALSDSILKVAQSSLNGGIDFKGSNFNVLFVGDQAQSLNNSNVLKGGSASSVVTFRDSDLNAGNGTTNGSSLQNIKGTIAFDLSHANEDMQISGTLSNMFASDGRYQTKFGEARGDNLDSLTFNKLVFVSMDNVANANTLTSLKTNGNYFSDSDTFGNLSSADYSQIGYIKDLDTTKNSSLTLANNAVVALNGANTEIFFIGSDSHGFDTTDTNATKLGNSSGSTLTFIDAGNLKLENIINADSSGAQQGKGTINLIGTTNFDLGSDTTKTLTLYKAGTTRTTPTITGAGITINAIFTGSNVLGGTGVAVQESGVTDANSLGNIASNVNIGQAGEQTTYHLLFDYTEALKGKTNYGFGNYQVYQGNITGLTSNSVIKFKNAGYINQEQIANTQATILVDNTQIKGNFRGDYAILDFRNNNSAISGKILTSDNRETDSILSQKTLIFDLTGTTKTTFTDNIQAGYKIAPDYTDNGQSTLTFQNAPTLTLGDDSNATRGANANPSEFVKSLANDVGFSGIGSAKTTEDDFSTQKEASYILKGTKLVFQGTNITASNADKSITENTYELDLSFDYRDNNRGSTGLGETLKQATLTANSIAMGEYKSDSSKPLGLSLFFKDKGSLVADNNTLNVKLKENARFNLTAVSDNGAIGTLILSQNNGSTPTALSNVSKDSSLSIAEGSMSFVGNFSQSEDQPSGANAGEINASFNDTNKIYGTLAGRGVMNVTISGEGVFDSTEMTNYSFAKPTNSDVFIDTSNATGGTITLSHTSGSVGVKGKTYESSGTQSNFTSINLGNYVGNENNSLTLQGAFDIGSASLNLSGNQFVVTDDLFLKVNSGNSITLKDIQIAKPTNPQDGQQTTKTLSIGAIGGVSNFAVNLALTNLDPNLIVELTSTTRNANIADWGNKGVWNIRGTNIQLTTAFWAENNTNLKKFVFAKGSGTQTTTNSLTLDQLTTEDKINQSALSGNIITATGGSGDTENVRNVIMKNGEMTFIGKQSLAVSEANQKFDGTQGKITFGLYNTILKSGSVLLDNTNNDNHSNLGKTASIQDIATLRGTDTFNLSVSKMANTTGANNSTIDAIFVNGTTTAPTDGTDNSITGVRYINSSNSYASSYATSNAGGALSETKLKTLESKAYGNITLDNTVTATMKFIGENSHSFDGKTAVNNNGTANNLADDTFYYSQTSSDSNGANWKKIEINDEGIVTLGTDNLGSAIGANIALATLSGGNSSSRFDFDHTSVSLEQIKNAGGKTYVYNSNIVGNIAVSGLAQTPVDPDAPVLKPNEITPSTTLFFNAVMEEKKEGVAISTNAQELTQTAKSFIDSQFKNELGINLDLSTAHTLSNENLTNNSGYKLGTTTKQTNLVLIGKGSVSANGANGNGSAIDLSFLPDANNSANYAYTLISGGVIDSSVLDRVASQYEQDATIFGNSKVQLVDTYVIGARNYADTGFINTNLDHNQQSSWGGGETIEQYLIFNMGGKPNQLNKNGSTDVIVNTSAQSRYIFSNLGAKEVTFTTNMKNTLNTAMNNVAPSTKQVIGNDVKGYLGLRGVSVVGDIDESNNGVDIVFNSTSDTNANQGIAYKEWFDSSNTHHSKIIEGEKNLVSHGTDYKEDPNISGYAVLKASSGKNEVAIKGSANKDITFIGANSVEGGMNNLRIEGGSKDSNYTFYSVGTLGDIFLGNIGLQKSGTPQEATAGSFTFENSTINGAINVDQNETRTDNSANVLAFKNVNYSGALSGSLKKNLVFGANSNDITIKGGGDDSSYDFSALCGKSVSLDIDMSKSGTTYYASNIAGFESGDISLVGSLKLAKVFSEVEGNYSNTYTNSFAFNDNAKWTLTADSRVMSLSLSNSSTNYNLDLTSAPRSSSKAVSDDTSKDLRVLEVGSLSGNGGQVLLGTIIDSDNQANSKSDKIKASVITSGTTLYITAKDYSLNSGTFSTSDSEAIVLVSADTSYGEVKGAERKQGLSYVATALEHQVSVDGNTWSEATQENTSTSNTHRWVLSRFDTSTNQELVDESGFIISNPYRMLLIETNNLNKRMGDLRDNDYNHGAWIRVFNGSDSGEGSKNLYTNIQLGYDYGTPSIGAKNYSGVAFSTSIVDIDGNQYSGKANTYSVALYNAYIADSGLYVDTIGKYLYTDQKLSPNGSSDSSFGSHALSLGLEVGYRAYMGESNFYFETQAEAIGGVIFGVKDIAMGNIGGMNITGDLKTTLSLNTRIGIVQGYSLKTQSGFRADFRLGVSLVNESVNDNNSITLYDSITEASTSIANDTKAVLNVGTNLILTDQWRVYLDAERSFGGKRNVDYQANIGARFSFGDITKPLPKPEKPLPLKVGEKE
ncbi:hypothetical protein [Helicobacter brantae]|uniref:hypothetical protein n=1 Tax=Helicobacter brantae TaxID=375927 RepID=UPI0011C0503B|nr:hypothetical protein [Helicobacter brantae]